MGSARAAEGVPRAPARPRGEMISLWWRLCCSQLLCSSTPQPKWQPLRSPHMQQEGKREAGALAFQAHGKEFSTLL